jgi:glycosyltransferase involved in cell wall biosynthesis
MAGDPQVSVCMPLYNTERFIEEAIRGVLSQTYRNLELVICDNGSTDRSVQIVEGLARQDPRVKFVRNRRNIGYAGNLHKVLSLARGDFLLVHLADDLAAPTAIEKMVRLATTLPNGGANAMVITDSFVADAQGKPTMAHRKRPGGYDVAWEQLSDYSATRAVDRFKGREALKDALPRLNIVGWVGATMFSRKLFESVEGVYNGLLYSPDLQFNYHLLSCDPDVAWLREPLFYWRQHEAGHIGQARSHAIPKHAWDGYTYTFHFSPAQLKGWGIDPSAIAYTFVDSLCLRKALIEVRTGSRLLGFRHLCIGLATYPGVTVRNAKFYVALLGIMTGPLGRLLAQAGYRLQLWRQKK